MEKIVILTRHSEEYKMLIELLKMLFPECEIEVISTETESFAHVHVSTEPATREKGGKE